MSFKLIREIRMGPSKTYKTGSIVSTYPNPKLVLEGDEGGLDVVQQAIDWVLPSTATTNQLETRCILKREALPPITAVQFNVKAQPRLDDLWRPTGDKKSFEDFNKTVNTLFLKGCPWKTVIIDPVTVVQDMVLASFAETNSAKMEDARKWAGAVGEKVKRILATMFTLPCHVVVIMHTAKLTIRDPKTNEVTSETQEPVIYGKIRDFIGSLPSQFFYHDSQVIGGIAKAFIQTMPDGRVKGIGARWPAGLPMKCNADFNSIYGTSVQKGETWS